MSKMSAGSGFRIVAKWFALLTQWFCQSVLIPVFYFRAMIMVAHSLFFWRIRPYLRRYHFFSHLLMMHKNHQSLAEISFTASGNARPVSVKTSLWSFPLLKGAFDLFLGCGCIIYLIEKLDWVIPVSGLNNHRATELVLCLAFLTIYINFRVFLRKWYKKNIGYSDTQNLLSGVNTGLQGFYIRICLFSAFLVSGSFIKRYYWIEACFFPALYTVAFLRLLVFRRSDAVPIYKMQQKLLQGKPLSEAINSMSSGLCEPLFSLYFKMAERFGNQQKALEEICRYYDRLIERRSKSNYMYGLMLFGQLILVCLVFHFFCSYIFDSLIREVRWMDPDKLMIPLFSKSISFSLMRDVMDAISFMLKWGGIGVVMSFSALIIFRCYRKQGVHRHVHFLLRTLFLNHAIVACIWCFFCRLNSDFHFWQHYYEFFFWPISIAVCLPVFCCGLFNIMAGTVYYSQGLSRFLPNILRNAVSEELLLIIRFLRLDPSDLCADLRDISTCTTSIILSFFLKKMAVDVENGTPFHQLLSHPFFPVAYQQKALQMLLLDEVEPESDTEPESIDSSPIQPKLILLHLFIAALIFLSLFTIYGFCLAIISVEGVSL